MNEQEKSTQSETRDTLISSNDNIESNTVSNETKIENGKSSVTIDEKDKDSTVKSDEEQVKKEFSILNNDKKEKISFTLNPPNISKTHLKEKPKIVINYKKDDDDIEEFDTDEEEEENQSKEQSSTQPNYSNNISYEGNKCIYTEPGTGRKLIWNSEENKWCPAEESQQSGNTTDAMKNYKFDGKHYVYTDATSNVTYKFIQEKNEWVVKDDEEDEAKDEETESENAPPQPNSGAVYGFENDTHTYTDPNDGMTYFWDREKNAWFPKIDDDFMARYQMSYGFNDSNTNTNESSSKEPKSDLEPQPPEQPKPPKLTKEEKKAENKRKNQEPATWFDVDEAHNTTIYLSNLPLDITMDELKELVTKCGLLARDEKGVDKIKLYTDSDGETKGDARCTYIKVESVNLALDILDGWQLRDKTISVQRAKFQLKGEYNPSLKPKRKKKDKDKQKKIHEKLFDWRPDRLRGEPLKCERVVILKNLFKPEDFDKDVTLLLEYQQDVRSECIKCGEVKKVTIYDRHPEGVAQVAFKEVEEAQACIELLNGRWFGQRRITAEIWDGKTKYKIKETEEQIEARINKWDKFLEEQDEAEEKAKKDAAEAKTKKNVAGNEAKIEVEAHSQSSSSEKTV